MRKRKRYFDDYDFEEAYQKSIDDMQQSEIERSFRAKKGIAYQTKTTKAGDQLEADIYPTFGNRQDAPRTKRGNKSRPAQKNLNDKRAKRYLNNLISANFGQGDIWATFTYDDDHLPESPDEADKIFANYIRRVNRRRKKRRTRSAGHRRQCLPSVQSMEIMPSWRFLAASSGLHVIAARSELRYTAS